MAIASNALTTAPRAAIYVRVSSVGQEQDGSSLETQEAACRTYAAARGYVVDEADVYREIHTGTELWERPALQRLRWRVRQREVTVVVAYAIDRLSRDPVHLGVILSEAEHDGAEVHFVTEPLDNSPEGQLIRFVRGYAAKVEHVKITERTMRGKLARARAGKPLPGWKNPYGLVPNADRSAYAEDPGTARVVRRIFAELAEGASLRTVCRGLERDAIPPPAAGLRAPRGLGAGQAWFPSTVRTIARNPIYAGQAEAFRVRVVKRPGGTLAAVPREDPIVLPGRVAPALVDPVTFLAARQRLAGNRERATGRPKNPEAALLRGGHVRCGDCGRALHAHTEQDGRVIYRDAVRNDRYDCPSRPTISARILDTAVWQRVEDVLTKPDVIARELERQCEAGPEAVDLAAVDRRLATVARRQANLIDQLADLGADVAALVRGKLGDLDAERAALLSERGDLERRQQSREQARQRLRDVQAWCARVASRLDTFTYAEKRDALLALGVQVRVWRKGSPERWAVELGIPLETGTTALFTSS